MRTIKKIFFLVATICLTFMYACTSNQEGELLKDKAEKNIAKSRNESETILITHNYDYYGKKFSVEYKFNPESGEVLSTKGDLEIAEELFSNEENVPKGYLFENIKGGSTTINIKLFKTSEEVGRSKSPEKGKSDAKAKGMCNNYDFWGSSTKFYFYKNINMLTEMTGMRRTNRYLFGNYKLSPEYDDELSSFNIHKTTSSKQKVTVDLFEHPCYNGKKYSFTHSYSFFVLDLRRYTLSGWWLWKTSWNDQVSSVAGGDH